ncbi:hypothetical protein FHS57_005722 [Runella defluvii]|uniref:Uncharacterized protein n=1 Tax=Runella defluvii TaxID=370973 RepID=A0A7W6ETF9_9BACT|nr:hypothetical protein [Runella defluvii]
MFIMVFINERDYNEFALLFFNQLLTFPKTT